MVDDLTRKPKSFWQKPEGKTGILVGGGLLIAGAWGLNLILPFLISLMTNMITAIGLAAVLALLFVVATDKRMWTLGSYLYKSAMRKLTGLIIEMDPIGILRGYVEDLREKRAHMLSAMGDLDKQIRKLSDKISRKEEERVHSLKTAQQAQAKDMKTAFVLQSRKAGRLQKSTMTLQGLLVKMKGMRRVLQKMYESADFMVQDMENEVEVRSDERDAILATHSAFKSAKAIISGESDKKQVFDQAMEFLADDYSARVGDIESFIQSAEGFLQTVDLENGVYEEDALEQFEVWEKKADQLILGPGDAHVTLSQALDATPSPTRRSKVPVLVSSNTSRVETGFSDLFGDDD